MKALYDTVDQKTLRYPRADDEPVVGLEPHLVAVDVVNLPVPSHNRMTEKLVPFQTVDMAARTVTRGWTVEPLAANEFPVLGRKTWPNSAAFLAEFMPGNDLSKLAAIQNSSNQKIAALRLLLSVWVGEIWSDDPRILLGMAELVKIGILTEQEKTDILTP